MLGINTNIAAHIALGGLRSSTSMFQASAERLSTGLRINRASDDPPAFVSINVFQHQMAATSAAMKNVLLARNTLDVAQGGMTQIYDRLVKLRATALRALGSDIATTDRSLLQDEAELLLQQIDRIAHSTALGGNRILNGSGDFFTSATAKAFDDIRVNRMTFPINGTTRDFTMNLTRAAERATLVTNLDIAGENGVLGSGASATVIQISGPRSSANIAVNSTMTAAQLAYQINASSEATGVYASTRVVNGAESAVQVFDIDADLELVTGFNSITADVTVGGSTVAITIQASRDVDGDGDLDITRADFERALNSANLGNFSVLGGDDDSNADLTLDTSSWVIRHAGATDFIINNFAGAGLDAGSSLNGLVINGTEPPAARMITNGLNFDPTTRDVTFNMQTFAAGGGTSTSSVTILAAGVTDATYGSGADLTAAFGGMITATYLGRNANGEPVFYLQAAAGIDAFRLSEATAGSTDAADIGLLSDSGGGDGIGSTGMAVLTLYSEDFGGNQSVSMRNAGEDDLAFNILNESNSINAGLQAGSLDLRAFGVDAAALVNGTRVTGSGWHLNYSSSYASIDLDLTARFGAGSFTNSINRAINLNYANPSALTMYGFRSLSQVYDGSSFTVTNVNDLVGTQMQADGIIDSVTFTVYSQVPNSRARSGLASQITDGSGLREYVSIRNFDISHLGGLPSSEGGFRDRGTELLKGQGTLSQIRRGGAYTLEHSNESIADAIAIIDRAIKQTLDQQAQTGLFQTVTLDRQRDYLEGMLETVGQGLQDLSATDVPAEVAAFSLAQLKVSAATSVLAQANSIPQTLLTLLR